MSKKVQMMLAVVACCALWISGCGSDTSTTDSASSAAVDDDHDDHADEDDHDDDHADDDDGHEDHADDDGDHEDHDGNGLGAHEHGAAELTVAWVGSDVVVDLISPTFNIFGFEYKPESDEDIALAQDRQAVLESAGVLGLNAEANCALTGDVATDVEYEGSHSELTATWAYTCANPDEIAYLDASVLFAEFPNFADVDAQWVSDSGQSAGELTPTATKLDLK